MVSIYGIPVFVTKDRLKMMTATAVTGIPFIAIFSGFRKMISLIVKGARYRRGNFAQNFDNVL
jgi:hypothetical protein